jgi:wyosine [tRNA(Phe)-imidazoG37] synthetase (radical SAM superfamily)
VKNVENIIFGPVPSRRFGKSLGIDLFPSKKTCTFNCVYCEVGEGKPVEFASNTVSADSVIASLSDYLQQCGSNLPDFITFAGSGEPTMHPEIDLIIDQIKRITNIPVVLLTNGSKFYDKNIRQKVLRTDYLVPSLDAGFEKTFLKVNRPFESFSFEKLVKGLVAMRNEFKGIYILEILLVGGLNTSDKEFIRLKSLVDLINPDFVQINTVFRPPAVKGIREATFEEREKLANLIGKKAETVCYYKQKNAPSFLKGELLKNAILDTVKIRPCTIEELADSLCAERFEMEKTVNLLASEGKIKKSIFNKNIYLTVK